MSSCHTRRLGSHSSNPDQELSRIYRTRSNDSCPQRTFTDIVTAVSVTAETMCCLRSSARPSPCRSLMDGPHSACGKASYSSTQMATIPHDRCGSVSLLGRCRRAPTSPSRGVRLRPGVGRVPSTSLAVPRNSQLDFVAAGLENEFPIRAVAVAPASALGSSEIS